MSERLRYNVTSNHEEQITGRIIASDLSFYINVGNGQYAVGITQDGNKDGIHLHGGTLPELIEALQVIHDLYTEAVGRIARAVESETAQ